MNLKMTFTSTKFDRLIVSIKEKQILKKRFSKSSNIKIIYIDVLKIKETNNKVSYHFQVNVTNVSFVIHKLHTPEYIIWLTGEITGEKLQIIEINYGKTKYNIIIKVNVSRLNIK